jgi:hypothetical protein
MSLQCVVHCVNAVVFALEPAHGKLHQLDIAAEILSYTRQSLHTELSNFQVMAVTTAGDGLQDLVKVLLGGLDLLWLSRGDGIFNLYFEHHGKMLAVLVNLLIPIYHWLEPSFHTLDDTVGEKLVVIRKKSGRLFGLHAQGST